MHRHAPTCTDIHGYAQTCTDMHRHVSICTNMCTHNTRRNYTPGHIWALWASTTHEGITRQCTFGHPEHLQNIKDLHVWAHLDIMDIHKTRRNYTSGHVRASWALTTHEGCVCLDTSGHTGHPQNKSGITHVCTCGHPCRDICMCVHILSYSVRKKYSTQNMYKLYIWEMHQCIRCIECIECIGIYWIYWIYWIYSIYCVYWKHTSFKMN